MKAKKQLLGFTAASLTLGAVFMAGGAPIPFYHTYAETLGLDKGVLSLVTVAYFAGTVIALLFLPRLTNYWGRKRAIYLTLAFGLAGCFLFGNVTGEWRMLAARFMQGLSCGLASSTVAAVIIGSAPNIGLPLGAMGSGVFNMFSDAIGMVFVIVAVLLVGCGALVFASTETITKKQSGAWRSLKPQLKITPRVKKLLPAAACAFAGTWAVGGFYQSYSAAIGIQELGVQSTFVASLTFVSFIAPVALGAALSRGRDKFLLQRFSMLAFFIAVAGVVYAIYSHSLSLFLAFNVMAGIADGAAFTTSMAGIVEGTSLQERAGVLSLIYVVAYGGAALPNLLVSRIAQYFSLLELTAGYAVFTGVMFILVLLTAKRSYYYEA